MAFLRSIKLNYKDIVISEIALDGLDGIGLQLLWKRIETCTSSPMNDKLKERLWILMMANDSITFYVLKDPVTNMEVLDRFSIIDENSGNLIDPPDYVDGPYEYCPIENEYGSSKTFKTRTLLPKTELENIPYVDVYKTYGDNIVMVASIKERWRALASHLPITYLNMLTPIHYCILELIGKSRENGQMTVGKTNLTKIVNESKFLFYYRKHLLKLDLIKVQYITQVVSGKLMKVILLRLKKYHKPHIQSLPKLGRIHNIVKYLLNQPDFCEQNDVMISKGFLTTQHSKKLQKTFNIFTFEDKLVNADEYSKAKPSSQKLSSKRRYICLNPTSDDDSQSDDEVDSAPIKCQYKVGVSILRQAYERFLDAGLKGLTQIEIAQLLGVEFYTSRSICRIFKARNIIREFLEDKGRQRTARYVALAATKDLDKSFADEKKKILDFYDDTKTTLENKLKRAVDDSQNHDSIIPKKKSRQTKDTEDTFATAITETQSLEGIDVSGESLINSKKTPTLRQLKFANGMLKVIKERQYIIGFQTLGNLVCKETGQPTMDTKAIKKFIQRLVTDGQLKILKLKRPGPDNKFYYLICAAHIKATDPIIKAKYKEICLRAEINKKKHNKNSEDIVTRPFSEYTYPRFMKIQKIHQHIMSMVYFNDIKDNNFPTGFTTMISIIPEMTVEFALGNIGYAEVHEVAKFKVKEDLLGIKLKDAPKTIAKTIIESKGLRNSVWLSLKVLALLGLIQIIKNPPAGTKTGLHLVFYANRHAKILNTTGRWPRDDNIKSLERSFYFETAEDVENFWAVVSDISTKTVINIAGRDRYKLDFPLRNDHSVIDCDNGERFGDGSGPCGYDSSIFMDSPRLWTTFLTRSLKKTKKKTVKRISTKRIIRPANVKEVYVNSNKPRVQLQKVKVEKNVPVKVKLRRKRDTNLISWSKFEDRVLIMCKVAITIISPVPQPGCLRIRNIVSKDLLALLDPQKTASVCHKRSMYLESNSLLSHDKDSMLSEIRRHHGLMAKYAGLLKILKTIQYVNLNKLINEARLPMFELIWMIYQMDKNKTFNQQKSCVAVDYKDFHTHYTINLSNANRDINLYKTTPSNELEYGAIKEGITMAVMLSCEHELTKETSKQMYTIFKRYPEPLLRNAIDELRKGGAIVQREKSMNYHAGTMSFDNLTRSAFKMSAFYRRKWLNRLQGNFCDELSNMIDAEIPTSGLKGSPELNCLFCEIQSCDVIDIVSDIAPVVTGSAGSIMQEEAMNVIDIETKYKLKSGTIGWKNKKNHQVFSELFETSDHNSILTSIARESVVTLKAKQSSYRKNDIILYLEDMGFKGSTFKELKIFLSIDEKTLVKRLMELEKADIIKRIGYFQNKVMLMKYAKPLLLEVELDKYVIPSPWLNLNGEIRQDIFLKWVNVIVNKVFECPGCSIAYLCETSECISARSIQDICVFLEQCKCVTLKTMEYGEVDLFSDDDEIREFKDYNPYDSIEHIYVFPVKNFISRYIYVRKTMLNSEKYK